MLGKMTKVMEKSWNFIFGPNILRCLKTRNILLVKKICPKKAGFSAFLNHVKLKLVMESHGKVIEFYRPISV